MVINDQFDLFCIFTVQIKKCCFGCCCTAGGICYCCCHRGAVKGNDHANAYLLPSWDEPSERPTEEGTEEGEDGGVEGEGKGEEEKVRSFMERLEILRSNGHPFAQVSWHKKKGMHANLKSPLKCQIFVPTCGMVAGPL